MHVRVYVVRNGLIEFQDTLDAEGTRSAFTNSFRFAVGDVVDFAVGNNDAPADRDWIKLEAQIEKLQTQPAITAQPQNVTVSAGGSISFSVTATGTTPLTYLWRKDGVAIAGATSGTLTLNNVQAANAGAYTVVVSNAAGSVTSAEAVLTVNAAPIAPVITAQPLPQTVSAGAIATFSVTATGTAPLLYQWYKNGVAIAMPLKK